MPPPRAPAAIRPSPVRACVRAAGRTLACAAVAVGAAGCGLPPSEACADYVACQQEVDPSVDTSAYASGGSCWVNPQTAAVCDAQCAEALDALAEVPGAPDVCTR